MEKPTNIKDSHKLDLEFNDEKYHGNYRTCRSNQAVKQYMILNLFNNSKARAFLANIRFNV